MNVAIVIPAYNEAASIGEVIKSLRALDQNYSLVVVDDCSTDQTVKIALQHGATVLHHIVNRGQGAALKTGTLFALQQGADIVVHFDADGQFLAGDIAPLVAPLTADAADIVLGSRFLGKISNIPWQKRYVLMPLARLVSSVLFRTTLSDPQAGLRALTKAAVHSIDWQQDRMAHCSEITYRAQRQYLRIKEIPVTVVYRDFGQGLSGGIRILREFMVGALTAR